MTCLKSWISKFRIKKKGEPSSHLGLKIFKGAYLIPEEDENDFQTKYFEHVFVEKNKCDLIERHNNLCCLLYDLDFKKPLEFEERAYTQATINSFIECVVRVASKYIDAKYDAFDAFVCEKEKPTKKKDCIKDGVHIMFPYIVTEPALQHLIREEIIEEAENFFPEDENNIEQIVDISVLDTNGWMMYGSSKIDGHPYYLTGIWGYTSAEDLGLKLPVRVEDSPYYEPSKELVNLLSIRRFTMADVAVIREDMEDTVKHWIENFNATRHGNENSIPPRRFHGDLVNGYTPDLNTVEKLVAILDSNRSESRTPWIELGWCLHNISEEKLLECWIKFSERSVKYSDSARGECESEWNKMRQNGLGIGTLHMWAKKDNEKAYFEILRDDLEYFITKTVLKNTQCVSGKKQSQKLSQACVVNHIVTTLKLKYGHYFICSNYEKRQWHEFADNRWIKDDQDVSLKRKIREELHTDYMNVSNKYSRLSERLQNGHPNKQKYDSISDEIAKLAFMFKDTSFRKKVTEEASEQFYWFRDRSKNFDSNNFEEILDSKTHLVGFKNGVYDLELSVFREARCEDFVSLSTDIDFIEYSWDHEMVIEIQEFLAQILTNEPVREYVLRVLASILSGEISNEHFHIWVGTGGNGKSKLIDLFEYAFGKYCGKLSVSAITHKRASASAPQPELVRLRGKRLVVLQEPNEKEKIQVGFMKEISGGDKIVARTLNKEPIEFKPQFTLLLTCNELPEVPADDGGTWRRIKLVEFTSKFVLNPDPENPNEFPQDPHLDRKLKKWKNAFMWMLLEYYKIYKQEGYTEPKEVTAFTEQYQQLNDKYADFLKENILDDKNSTLYLDGVYSEFSVWYRETIDNKPPPSKREFTVYIEKRYGKIQYIQGRKGWRGKKLIEKQENELCNISDSDDD
tara:strand:+ start:7227 stop:9959 length:2733 start_codon:yes stop_codon:yes gene_type:complete